MLILKYCLFFFILVCISFCFTSAAHKKQLGVKLTNATECPNTEHQMDKNNPVTGRISIKGSSLIDINFNVSKPLGPISIALRVFQVLEDELKLIFKTDYLSCKHPLTFEVIRAVNGAVNKNCIIEKGNFWIRDININKFSWILTKAAAAPGPYIYELEYINVKGCIYCLRAVCEFFIKK